MSRKIPEIFIDDTSGIKERNYVDVNGVFRVLRRVKRGPNLNWHKSQTFSTSTDWLDENGYPLRIADGAWDAFGIKYTDKRI